MRLIRGAVAGLILTALAAGPAVAGVPVADLAIGKVGAPKPVPAGTNLTYTIVVQNGGPSAASNVSMNDSLPAPLTFVSLTNPGGWTLTTPAVGSGGTVTATIAGLTLANGPQVFTLVVHVDAATAPATIITNTATVFGTFDADLSNNTSVDSTDVIAAPPPTPAASVPNAAMPEAQTGSPFALLGFGALLASVLATAAVFNRRRYRSP
jgi:uncharacterized repeat protein (TIGR01451 family)